jgi:hypothetical protein
MRLRTAAILVSVVLLPSSGISWLVVRDYVQDANFARITNGMLPKEVIVLMGRPIRLLQYGETGGVHAPTTCSEEFVYASSGAPLLPWYPTVCFVNDGRVVSKYAFTSS